MVPNGPELVPLHDHNDIKQTNSTGGFGDALWSILLPLSMTAARSGYYHPEVLYYRPARPYSTDHTVF